MAGVFILFVVSVLIFVLWGMLEVGHVKHKIKHKIFTIFLIGFFLFILITGVFVFKGKTIDLNSKEGIFEAGKVYFSFLGTVGKNVFALTANAVNMDWNLGNNQSQIKK